MKEVRYHFIIIYTLIFTRHSSIFTKYYYAFFLLYTTFKERSWLKLALFKVFKGTSANLPTEKHDGYCYFTTDDGQFYIDYLDSDGETLRRRPISGPGSSVEYIVGTQTSSTNAWTGITKDPALYEGKTIVYKLPYAGTSSNATLTLTFTNPTDAANSGAKPVYYTGSTRITTHYGAGSVILLTYDGSGWRRADYNTNTNTFVTQSASTTTEWRKVLLHYTTNSAGGAVPSTVTNQVYAAQGIEVQPSSGTLSATKFKGPLEGNADTATAFSSAANVTLTGDVTGTASSTKGWSVATTLANSGVTAGNYGPNANATPSYGNSFDVPYITVDSKGRITAASTKTVTIPTSDNTDTLVSQSNNILNADYRVLLSYGANDNTEINTVNKNGNLIYNPSTNKLSTGNLDLSGDLEINGDAYLNNITYADDIEAGTLLVTGNANFVQMPTAPTAAKATNDTTLATTAFVKTITGDYLPLAGGTLTGQLKWTSNSLPSVTNADYFLIIDAFANGGATKYITKANALKAMVGSSAIGSSTNPIYWTGSAFNAITSYSGTAALTGTPTAPTAAAGTNTTQIATTEFVTNAVAQGFSANDAMVFKGLIGSNQTITGLPTSNYSAGWTYRVADAGIFAGEYCEVGDLLIAINDGPSSGSSVINTDWGKVEHNIDGAVFRGAGASNSSVGSSTQPVYVNGSGIVTAITGAIANDTTGNAATATKATQDGSGNVITSTYVKKAGDTMSGSLLVENTANNTAGLKMAIVTQSYSFGLHMGTGGINHGLYDFKAQKWIVLGDSSHNWTFKGNADTATKATQDESGNNIKASYAASFSISDHTITLKNKNGASLGTVTVPDNNTTYTFADGTDGSFTVTPSGGSAQTVSIGKPAAAGTADAVAWSGITGKPSTFTPPLAADGTRGGIQIGYSESGTNYAVKLSNEKAYVTVPWTDTATAADNILDGSNSGTEITYAPYSTQQSKLSFDTSSTAPSRTDRLNLNGYLYATKLYSGGVEVLTTHQSLKYHKTGSWSGLTYTATAINSAEELAFTIPTGTTATTVAVGNHTHTTALAVDTGTSSITLAHEGKYKLTAGDTSVIFTMPADNDTTYTITSGVNKITVTPSSGNAYDVDIGVEVVRLA